MRESTWNARQFQSSMRSEDREVDPIVEAVRRLQGDEGVHRVVDPENPSQETNWDPWG